MSEQIDLYDSEFFAEQGTAKAIRKEVGIWVRRYASTTGKTHSLAWRTAYIRLEEKTGFRGPAKKTLDAIEKEGLLDELLVVVKRLAASGRDSASEGCQSIPELQTHVSDREATGCVPGWAKDDGSPDEQ